MSRKTKRFILITLGVAIIVYILSKVDLNQLLDILKQTDKAFLIAGLSISIIPTIINSFKWHLLLQHKDICIPFHLIFNSQMIGMFISSFLPSRYSGDAYRIFLIAKYSGKGHDTVASVILQRVSGLFVLVIICVIGAIFCAIHFQLQELTLVVMIACIMILVCIGLIFNFKAYSLLDRLIGLTRFHKLRTHLQSLFTSLEGYRKEYKLLVWLCALSIIFYLFAFATVHLACFAINVEVPFIFIVFVLPVIYLLEALPISINGFGIREGAFIFFFTKIGVGLEEAFAISLVILFYRLIKTIVGGLLFATHPSVSDFQAKGISS